MLVAMKGELETPRCHGLVPWSLHLGSFMEVRTQISHQREPPMGQAHGILRISVAFIPSCQRDCSTGQARGIRKFHSDFSSGERDTPQCKPVAST